MSQPLKTYSLVPTLKTYSLVPTFQNLQPCPNLSKPTALSQPLKTYSLVLTFRNLQPCPNFKNLHPCPNFKNLQPCPKLSKPTTLSQAFKTYPPSTLKNLHIYSLYPTFKNPSPSFKTSLSTFEKCPNINLSKPPPSPHKLFLLLSFSNF